MILEELKSELTAMQLPTEIRLSEWEYIGNVQGFLSTQYQLCEQASTRYASTPAWERLMRFREVISSNENVKR